MGREGEDVRRRFLRRAGWAVTAAVLAGGCGGGAAPSRAPVTSAPDAGVAESEPPARPAFRSTLAARGAHMCALTPDGAAWCWGDNRFTQLGVIEPADRSPAPVRVQGDHAWIAISAGEAHTCGVTTEGELRCWGRVNWPVGPVKPSERAAFASPRPPQEGAGRGFVDVVAGVTHSCALLEGGEAACWGWNDVGQVGNAAARSDIEPLRRVLHTPNWRGLAVGERYACGVTADGRVKCWGTNERGQLGRHLRVGKCARTQRGGMAALIAGTRPCGTVPMAARVEGDFVAVSSGPHHTCALRGDGEMWCWGANDHAQLGRGGQSGFETLPTIVPQAPRFVRIAAGGDHTCALTAAGDAWCWGRNDRGQLGTGTTEEAVLAARVATDVALVELVAGQHHTCGADADGRVFCWGAGDRGQLGYPPPDTCGDVPCSRTPRPLATDLRIALPTR